MIVDTSAVVAIASSEADSDVYKAALTSSTNTAMSAGNYLECAIVLDNHRHPSLGRALDRLLTAARISIAPVTPEQAAIARAAYQRFGRGSRHPARLNFGDCFAYALAIERDEPLLYKGNDFGHTDVRNALEDT